MTTNTGGPAFPTGTGGNTPYSNGMTLRDYFAAKAMQSILTSYKIENCDDFVVANCAYQMADFMLKAREQK